jgi:signal transduction histidine kinase
MQNRYPADSLIDSKWTRMMIGDGITGWVALHRQSLLINDVRRDNRYKAFFTDMGSELCVPLIDKGDHVLGILNVESNRNGAFSRKDQRALEALADRAVIAIQNARNQEQLILASLGDLAGSWLHWIYGQMGLIRTKAIDIQQSKTSDLESKRVATKMRELTDQIIEEAKKLQTWIPEEPHPIALQEVVNAALQKVHIASEATTIIQTDIPNDLPRVMGGEQQLIYVIVNLIQNAIDATLVGGAVSVKGKHLQLEGASWVGISVRDTGKGIPEAMKDQIFTRSFTTKGEKGLGFGLWWAQLYIQRLGGQLTFESRPGEWTQFDLALPAYEATQRQRITQ